MSSAVMPDDLVGTKEIAERLGVLRTTVSMWHARRATSGFPEPVRSLAAGPVFDWTAVQAWYEGRRPA